MHTVDTEIYYQVFTSLRLAGCTIVPIRYRRVDDIEVFSGDYDFLINPAHLDMALNVIRKTLSEHGVTFAIWRRKKGKTRIDILEPNNRVIICIELWSFLESRKADGAHPCISWQNISGHIQASNESYTGFSFTPDIEALYYICHLLEKRKSIKTELVAERLHYYSELTGVESDTRLFISRIKSDKDIKQAAASAYKALIARKILTQTDSISRKLTSYCHLASEAIEKALLQKAKHHRFVFFIGPDGVGKTSLIQGACKNDSAARYIKFKNIYRKNIIYAIYYPLAKIVIQARHKTKIKKNQVDDLSSTPLLLIATLGISLINLAYTILRRKAFCDRSAADLLIAGHRFPMNKKMTLKKSRILTLMAPRGRAVIHLHADISTIHSRKKEMSEQQITDYQEAVFSAYTSNPSPLYVCINTSHSISDCLGMMNYFLEPSDRRP